MNAFCTMQDGGQPGSPSSLGIWKLRFFLYLKKAEAPQLCSSGWGWKVLGAQRLVGW